MSKATENKVRVLLAARKVAQEYGWTVFGGYLYSPIPSRNTWRLVSGVRLYVRGQRVQAREPDNGNKLLWSGLPEQFGSFLAHYYFATKIDQPREGETS